MLRPDKDYDKIARLNDQLARAEAELARVNSGYDADMSAWTGRIHRLEVQLAQAQARAERFQRLGEEGYASLALQSRDAILHEFCQLQIKYGEQKHEIRGLQAREARLRGLLERARAALSIDAIPLTILQGDIYEALTETQEGG